MAPAMAPISNLNKGANMAMTETERTALIQATAKAVINDAKVVSWNQQAHCAFLVRLIGAAGVEMTPEQKQELYALLQLHGAGGNASQFKQKLGSGKNCWGLLESSTDDSDPFAGVL